MHIRTHIHHPWSAEFASFLKMSNLTIENLFQKTLADVKAALEKVSEQCLMKVWSKHLYERGSHVVLLYAGPQKPFSTSDSISLWGHFPKKGRLISKGKNYVLYHRDTFLDEFQNKSPEEVIILSKKLLGISGGERSKKKLEGLESTFTQSKKAGLKRYKQPQYVNTCEDACDQIVLQVAQDESLQIIHEQMLEEMKSKLALAGYYAHFEK